MRTNGLSETLLFNGGDHQPRHRHGM